MTEVNKGHNITALKKDIMVALDELREAAGIRGDANIDAKAARDRMERQGIPKKALAFGEQMREMDEDKRNAILAALPIVLEAIGTPFDPQLALTVPPEKE